MSNKAQKKSSNRPAAKVPREKTNFLPLLAAAAVVICVAVVFLYKETGTQTRAEIQAAKTVKQLLLPPVIRW